jgi:DNA-binding NarL/FixJ family response regulator
VTLAGTGSSIAEAVQLVGALHPDVVFLDTRLGGESGFDAARQLAVGGHVGAVIMISTHAEADYADLLTESPVLGFLPNGQQSGVAIRRILGRN